MKKTNKKSKPSKKVKKKKPVTKIKLETTVEESEDKKKADSYDEHGCEYLNEAECEEELEEDGLDLDEVESEHFEEEKE